jgi:hypothetical protein
MSQNLDKNLVLGAGPKAAATSALLYRSTPLETNSSFINKGIAYGKNFSLPQD